MRRNNPAELRQPAAQWRHGRSTHSTGLNGYAPNSLPLELQIGVRHPIVVRRLQTGALHDWREHNGQGSIDEGSAIKRDDRSSNIAKTRSICPVGQLWYRGLVSRFVSTRSESHLFSGVRCCLTAGQNRAENRGIREKIHIWDLTRAKGALNLLPASLQAIAGLRGAIAAGGSR
jgi:hypothetical protein